MPATDLADLAAEVAGLRDALARVAVVTQRPAEPYVPIEIARTSGGATRIAVKTRHANPVEAATLPQWLYAQCAHRYDVQQERDA